MFRNLQRPNASPPGTPQAAEFAPLSDSLSVKDGKTYSPSAWGFFFLSVGLFHLKHALLLSLLPSHTASILPNTVSRRNKPTTNSLRWAHGWAGFVPCSVPALSAHTSSSTALLLSTLCDITGLGHMFNPGALTVLHRAACSNRSFSKTRQGLRPSTTSYAHFYVTLPVSFQQPAPGKEKVMPLFTLSPKSAC